MRYLADGGITAQQGFVGAQPTMSANPIASSVAAPPSGAVSTPYNGGAYPTTGGNSPGAIASNAMLANSYTPYSPTPLSADQWAANSALINQDQSLSNTPWATYNDPFGGKSVTNPDGTVSWQSNAPGHMSSPVDQNGNPIAADIAKLTANGQGGFDKAYTTQQDYLNSLWTQGHPSPQAAPQQNVPGVNNPLLHPELRHPGFGNPQQQDYKQPLNPYAANPNNAVSDGQWNEFQNQLARNPNSGVGGVLSQIGMQPQSPNQPWGRYQNNVPSARQMGPGSEIGGALRQAYAAGGMVRWGCR